MTDLSQERIREIAANLHRMANWCASIHIKDRREISAGSKAIKAMALRTSALEAENAVLREALEECVEYFDDRADAEYFTDSPAPVANEEMRLLVAARKALEGK